jgi:hypothetical protein
LTVGFTERPPSQKEVIEDADAGSPKRRSEDAGWTVLCNERAVVFNDKSFLTGWGERPVPNYHSQFIAIAGVVEFRSADAKLLPMTTTKHGVDASSPIYLHVKNYMREGMKIFTDYTNRWKKHQEDVETQYKDAGEPLQISEIKERAAKLQFSKPNRGKYEEEVFRPSLPKPTHSSSNRTISFVRPLEEIQKVSTILFGGSGTSPKEVGEACFDRVLSEDT